jgi:hypothetical protein
VRADKKSRYIELVMNVKKDICINMYVNGELMGGGSYLQDYGCRCKKLFGRCKLDPIVHLLPQSQAIIVALICLERDSRNPMEHDKRALEIIRS